MRNLMTTVTYLKRDLRLYSTFPFDVVCMRILKEKTPARKAIDFVLGSEEVRV